MPKRVMSLLLSRMIEDIRSGYIIGSRYRTVREVGNHFSVSLQTAHRAVHELVEQGVLSSHVGSGIRILSLGLARDCLRGQKLLVVSDNPDPRFNSAFMEGIRDVLGPMGMVPVLYMNREKDTRSHGFGEFLLNQVRAAGASGLVALYFRDADLPLYYLIANGIPVISDIILDPLPPLAAVQTDNRLHIRKAAQLFFQWKKRKVLTVGFWRSPNVRNQIFQEEFLRLNPDGVVQYLELTDSRYPAYLYSFFREFNSSCGIFSLDYSANHAIASHLLANGMDGQGNFLVYDSEEEHFFLRDDLSVPAVAPSLRQIGQRLGTKMVFRLINGHWNEPVQERI